MVKQVSGANITPVFISEDGYGNIPSISALYVSYQPVKWIDIAKDGAELGNRPHTWPTELIATHTRML
jgi:hypothetical protein